MYKRQGPGRYEEYRITGRVLPAETRAYVATLAPLLGRDAAADVLAMAPSPPPDWREAPLFVAQSTGKVAAVNQLPGDTSATVPVRDPVDAVSQVGSIFVARAGNGDAP